MRTYTLYGLAGAALLASVASGCSSRSIAQQSPGYLATDSCAQNTTAALCGATSGCNWVSLAVATPNSEPVCNGGTCPGPACCANNSPPSSAGACVSIDPCLQISGQASCNGNPQCAWSVLKTLCPVGADCVGGGFCHARGSNGDCACVSPVACPVGQPCSTVECDCASGGGEGNGVCSCNCPACGPGESCTPCACDCNAGGCQSAVTCACACPACADGASCAPCDCGCGTGGGAATVSSSSSPGSGAPEGCSQHADATSCNADTANDCGFVQPPCPEGVQCGYCAQKGSDSDGMTGCNPPPVPSPAPIGVACPGLGCGPACANGVKNDANGCPTCECA